MPRKPNIQLLQKLKEILEDPNIPSYEKTNSALARKLGVSKRYVIILKKKLSGELKNKFTGELIKSSPTFISTEKAKVQLSKTTCSSSKEARRELFSSCLDKGKSPVEMRLGSVGLEGLFGGLGLCGVHGLVLDCGVVGGAFERCKRCGYDFRFNGNLSHMFRVFKFGDKRYFEVRVYGNDRVVVYVSCSGNPLDDVDLINFWGFLSGELYRISGHKFIDADKIVVEKVELNNDSGVVEFIFKNSPVKVVTFKSFSGAFVRLYESKKRLEIGGPAKEALSLREAIRVMSGGMSAYWFQQIAAQFLQVMKYVHELREEVRILRERHDDLAGRLKNATFIPPKPVKSNGVDYKLNVDFSRPKSSQIKNEFNRCLSAQDNNVCPFYVDPNGCKAGLSSYATYVGDRIVEDYCTSGRWKKCDVYDYFMKRYGHLFKNLGGGG